MSAWLFAALLALSPLASGQDEPEPVSNCATCHGKEARVFSESIHRVAGVTCITCHGGSPDSVDVAGAHGTELKSLRGPREAVESCGGCHSDVERMRAFGLRTDQLSLYWTSGHGQQLAKGENADVATCVSCHSSHAVLSVKDPLSPAHPTKQVETCGGCHSDAQRMGKYGLPSDQADEYRKSVHGRALLELGHRAAPACADCHGSHGALPPRVDQVEFVCGNCHSTVDGFFKQSPHAKRADSPATIECVSCHDNHGVQKPGPRMFLGDDGGHCGACHADAADAARAVGQKLFDDVEQLAATIEAATLEVRTAGERGLFLGEERGYLDDARGLLVRARAMTHALSPALLDDVLERGKGMVAQTRDSLATKNRMFRDRRIFTGIFLGLSLLFAVMLWMYGLEVRGRARRASAVRGGAS
ncbi:MAG: cytochrome c3 family protein [Planctomycetes bacterium]|nr:cytochrome c3 family protein [Planctomycetota bacterium]